ncbi:MAG: carboxymuconolactone decarboxylase [Rhodospirillaceae bacterium]|nr:carboxymuconolactone decarboxylase [Rhodospirillaceae bacterium]
MKKNYVKVATELSDSVGRLTKGIPQTMRGFSIMGKAAKTTGSLDLKTKELIATAIAVAVRCDGCIAAHAKAAESNGASRDEILEMLSMAVYMGGGPSAVYAAEALDAFDQFSKISKK